MNEKVKHKRNKKKIALITILSLVAVFFLALMPVMSIAVYQDNFGNRYETADWMAYCTEEFEGLKVTECTFPSNKGQLLAGYQYSKEDQQIKGIVVLAHGFGGGGHNTYMDIADYFTSNGYDVFAYDATGNDKSEGESVEGLPQGVIDLDYALRFVKQAEEYQNLPIVLFGHSWGGYCAGSVLNCHADVKAAVLVAGFDRSTDLFEQQGESMIGSGIQLFMPYVSLYEQMKFGKYAGYSAIDGFANSDAGIMVIHSKADTMVLPENGYEKFYERFGDSPRFYFIEYEDRGHGDLYYTDAAREYKEQLNREYDAYVEANGGEYNAKIKAEFMEQHLDKSKSYELDENLMQQILKFYDSYCKEIIDAS